MSQLRRNVVANYLGQGWSAVMSLAFIPMYIHYLGMEAYGLIGVFAVLQAWLSLLDMGMTPTLNREMARHTAGAHSPESISTLLRTLEVLCVVIATAIGAVVWLLADYLASRWLNSEKLSPIVVAEAIRVMGLVVALRFLEGIYRGALLGLQKQVRYNAVNAVLATARYAGALGVLAWVEASIQIFFIWQALVSLVSALLFAHSVYQFLPTSSSTPRVSRAPLADVWRFAGGMMGISALVLLLTQMDKMLLSRLVSLEAFGYYALAAAVSGVFYMIISPITQAIFPRLVELSTGNRESVLSGAYHASAQLVSVLTAPTVLVLSLYPEGVIFAWSGDASLAVNTGPLLAALAIGTFLNGLMWIPYQCQLAHGWTGLTVRANLVAVVCLVPAILWTVPRYGAQGAAWIWALLNAGYVAFTIQFMHRRLLPQEKWQWYWADVFLPLAGAGIAVWLLHRLQPINYADRWAWLVFVLSAGVVGAVGAAALASRIRPKALSFAGLFGSGAVKIK